MNEQMKLETQQDMSWPAEHIAGSDALIRLAQAAGLGAVGLDVEVALGEGERGGEAVDDAPGAGPGILCLGLGAREGRQAGGAEQPEGGAGFQYAAAAGRCGISHGFLVSLAS